jgi:hypothetical protein
VRFEWDDEKNEINIRKHGIPFTTAVLIFEDPNCLTFPERIEAGETRWHAIGAVQGRGANRANHLRPPYSQSRKKTLC